MSSDDHWSTLCAADLESTGETIQQIRIATRDERKDENKTKTVNGAHRNVESKQQLVSENANLKRRLIQLENRDAELKALITTWRLQDAQNLMRSSDAPKRLSDIGDPKYTSTPVKGKDVPTRHPGTVPRIADGASINMRHLVGELAFQLDRRIVNYVFNVGHVSHDDGRQARFYGYTTRNIEQMISSEAAMLKQHCPEANKARQQWLTYRYNYVLSSLAALSFRVPYHPEFIIRTINKYGVFATPPPRDVRAQLEDADLLTRRVVNSVCDSEKRDILILADCLRLMSTDDGTAMFLW